MSKLILVIEDEGAIQRVIKAFLENEEWSKWQGFFFDEYIFPMVSLPFSVFQFSPE